MMHVASTPSPSASQVADRSPYGLAISSPDRDRSGLVARHRGLWLNPDRSRPVRILERSCVLAQGQSGMLSRAHASAASRLASAVESAMRRMSGSPLA